MFQITIADDDEMIGQAAISVDDREVALVFLHHADQHLRRQVLQITQVKTAQQSCWFFYQVANLHQEIRVFSKSSANFFRQRSCLLPDYIPTIRRIKDDAL